MKHKLRVAAAILGGMAVGSCISGSVLMWHYARISKKQYYAQMGSNANVVYMIRSGRQEELTRNIEANLAQCVMAADKLYGQDEKRLPAFWAIQRYYKTFDLETPPEIGSILAALPSRPLTSCEEKAACITEGTTTDAGQDATGNSPAADVRLKPESCCTPRRRVMKFVTIVVFPLLLWAATLSSVCAAEGTPPPRSELSKLTAAYVERFELKDDGRQMVVLADFRKQQAKLRESGWQPPWDGYKNVKSRADYEKLNTADLAKECFSTSLWARESLIYNDAAYGITRAGVFHDGFSTLYERADLWDGIGATLVSLAQKLEDAKTENETMDVLFTFKELKHAYTYPAFRDRLRGREPMLLRSNLAALKALLSYTKQAEQWPRRPFWGAVALDGVCCPVFALLKRTDSKKYAELIKGLDGIEVSFALPQPQQVETYLQPVIGTVEESIACRKGKTEF